MDYPGAARQAHRDGALLGVLFYDRVFYPGFQFGRDNRPLPVIADLLALASQRGRTEADLLAWLMTPSPLLPQIEGRDARSVDVLVTESEWVVKAARVEWVGHAGCTFRMIPLRKFRRRCIVTFISRATRVARERQSWQRH